MSGNARVTDPKAASQAVQDVVLYIARTAIRPVIRQELKSVGITEIFNVDSPDACVEALAQHPRAMLVLDWDHGPKVVNQILKAAQGAFRIDTRPIFLIAAEVSLDVVATGTEYNVSRIHTGEISRGAIQEHIELVVAEESDQHDLRASLTRVAHARSRADWTGAGDLLMELNRRFPDNRRISCELADNLIHEDRWDQALAVLDQLSLTDRHNLRVQHLKARCMMKLGQFDQAAALLQATKLINPFNVERLVDLGKALMNIGRIKDALVNFEAAIALNDDSGDARRGRLQCKLVEGDVNEALALLRQAANPREVASIFNNAAILAIRQTRFDQGLALYRTAIGALGLDGDTKAPMVPKPDGRADAKGRIQARLVYNLGIAFHKWGRVDDALECFERAYGIDPHFEKARHNAVIVALKLGRKPVFDARGAKAGRVEEDFTEVYDEEKVAR